MEDEHMKCIIWNTSYFKNWVCIGLRLLALLLLPQMPALNWHWLLVSSQSDVVVSVYVYICNYICICIFPSYFDQYLHLALLVVSTLTINAAFDLLFAICFIPNAMIELTIENADRIVSKSLSLKENLPFQN